MGMGVGLAGRWPPRGRVYGWDFGGGGLDKYSFAYVEGVVLG